MSFSSVDILVLAKACVSGQINDSYEKIGTHLEISASQAYRAVQCLEKHGLLFSGKKKVNKMKLSEFLLHAFKYVFPPEFSNHQSKGLVTGCSAPMHSKEFATAIPFVWEVDKGQAHLPLTEGMVLKPFDKRSIMVSLKDEVMYEILSLFEMFRIGKNREQKYAYNKIRSRIPV